VKASAGGSSGAARYALARKLFGVDARSLGLFRIGIGISLLAVLATYAERSRDLLAVDGALSLGTAAGWAGPDQAVYLLPFRVASGLFADLLPLTLGLLATGLALGYRARVCASGCWLLLTCLHVRNPAVVDFGDDLLLRLLFFGQFLPLGARFSLDARAGRARAPAEDSILSAASAALLLQFAALYFVAGNTKTGADWHADATAIDYVLQERYLARPPSEWLLGFPGIVRVLSRATPLWEISLPLLLFSPILTGPVRTLAAASVWVFHLGLALCLYLAAFPLVCLSGACAFLPAWFWERALPRRLRAPATPSAPAAAPPSPLARARAGAGQALVAALALLVLGMAASMLRPELPVPPLAGRLAGLLHLTQTWDMFAPNVEHRTGWIVLPGRLADGRWLDLSRNGAALSFEVPAQIPWADPNYRWALLLDKARESPREVGRDLLSWTCRRWNQEHGAGERLVEIEVNWLWVPIAPNAPLPPPNRLRSVVASCPAPPASGMLDPRFTGS
jgi:hypothetical protein